MKKALTICLWLLAVCASQSYAQAIPAGATGINLIAGQPDSTLFKAVLGFLETQDYVIEQADDQAYTLSTELNEASEPTMRVLVRVEEGTVQFTAEGRPSDWADTDQPFTNEGETRAGFLALNRLIDQFARSFANATVEYQTP